MPQTEFELRTPVQVYLLVPLSHWGSSVSTGLQIACRSLVKRVGSLTRGHSSYWNGCWPSGRRSYELCVSLLPTVCHCVTAANSMPLCHCCQQYAIVSLLPTVRHCTKHVSKMASLNLTVPCDTCHQPICGFPRKTRRDKQGCVNA